MNKTNQKIVKSLAVAMMLVGANAAMAETLTVPASVTVNNAIDFTFTGTLDFGQVRATASPTDKLCSGVTLSPIPAVPALTTATGTLFTTTCTGPGTSKLQGVGGTPARPVFTIAGVAPFTSLQLALPAGAIDLVAATGPDTAQFQLIDFTARKTSGTAGDITTTVSTDANGGATFTVGATLITHPEAITVTPPATTAPYQDLAYTGSFDVSVTY